MLILRGEEADSGVILGSILFACNAVAHLAFTTWWVSRLTMGYKVGKFEKIVPTSYCDILRSTGHERSQHN